MSGADGDNGTRGARASAFRRVVLGETGFERAAVWSAVGLALSYAAFDATGAAGLGPSVTAGALAAVAALGTVAFAAAGGRALPATLLACGPLAGTLLRALGPEPYVLPVSAGAPPVTAFTAPLALAAAVAVAVGTAATVVGVLVERIDS
ncbi:hypothetical protein EKH57_06175 [Halorubrum sp. BOL3-1]|uniref:hypothetical protein n=1 Tax=Halorubrum sp. BOL3-1 TaxID=2497325 RepID=UPI001004E8CC|nr:hypothetical protein [Halorubrum sp. BOL3-1]QAU12337.1 hypothetical protein EKH57_06175 [Halorubrum sp. BOL3-1]